MENLMLFNLALMWYPLGSIEIFRKEIDETDKVIITNLAKRSKLTEQIGRYKYENNLAIYDEKREKEIFNNLRKFAEENGLDPNLVEKVFEPVLEYSKKFQALNRQ
ncbi:MAG: chorismate mutase [archaeon]